MIIHLRIYYCVNSTSLNSINMTVTSYKQHSYHAILFILFSFGSQHNGESFTTLYVKDVIKKWWMISEDSDTSRYPIHIIVCDWLIKKYEVTFNTLTYTFPSLKMQSCVCVFVHACTHQYISRKKYILKFKTFLRHWWCLY